MPTTREWWARLTGIFGRGRDDDDLEQELKLHLELAADDERRRGGLQDEAARAAAIRNGNVSSTMEALRDQRGLPWVGDLGRDVRYTVRTLGRSPGFSAIVLLTLAIGIGANAAVFTVVNGVLLKPLPYPDPEELIAVWQTAPGAEGLTSVSGDLRLSASMFFTYAEHNHSFQNIGIWWPNVATVTGAGEPELLNVVSVSQGTLETLGVQPSIGRWFSAGDLSPGGARTVILAHGYWQRRLGGDPLVIGRRLVIDSEPYEIVGVMPAGFRVVDVDANLILPAQFDRKTLTLPGFGFQGVARLKKGVTIADASADVARMVPIWMRSWPAAASVDPRVYESWRIGPALRPLKQDVIGSAARALQILMGTLGIVLLIACANVATLLLVRAEGRQSELAIRAALGAGSGRIVRSLLIESAMLGLAGGVLGLAVATLGVRALLSQASAYLPRATEIGVDARVVVFTVVISLLSGLVFGFIPALKNASPQIAAGLAAGGRTVSESRDRHRARDILVVSQLALALVLLVTSGLMIRSVAAMRAVDPGFTDPDRLQLVRISIPDLLVKEPEKVTRTQQAIVDKLSALSGVESAAFISDMPLEGIPHDWDAVRAEDREYDGRETPPMRIFKTVSPEFFRTAGIRVIAGRGYTWSDLYERHPLTIVSDNMARELWGSASAALGKRIQTLPTAPWREVIGVVQDVRENGVDQPAPTIIYWPALGLHLYRPSRVTVERTVTFVVRSARAGSESFIREIQQAVWSENASLPLASVQTMQRAYDQSMGRTSFTLVILVIAAAMALTLGVVGIYGVVSYAVSQRTREIAIRVALGAEATSLTRLFVRSGLKLAAIGVPIGVVAAALLSRLMTSQLYEISPLDPVTFAAVPCVLVLAAVAASYFPARRAATVDPVEALKA
jgi:predicted permease